MTQLYSIQLRYTELSEGIKFQCEGNLLLDAGSIVSAIKHAESLPRFNKVCRPATYEAFELDEDEQGDPELREEAIKVPLRPEEVA